jgi:hypothetical protein
MVFGGLLTAQVALMFENSSKNDIFFGFSQKNTIFFLIIAKKFCFSGSRLIIKPKKFNLQNTILSGCLLKTWLKLAMSGGAGGSIQDFFFFEFIKKLFNPKVAHCFY